MLRVATLSGGGHWLTLVDLSLAWDWVGGVRLLELAHLRGVHVLRVSSRVVLGCVGLRVLLHTVTLLSQWDLLAGQWMGLLYNWGLVLISLVVSILNFNLWKSIRIHWTLLFKEAIQV